MGKYLEGDLQKKVIKYLNQEHIWHYRTQMGTKSGLPDLICCIDGRFVGLELKRPDGKGVATGQQEKVLRDIVDSGGYGWLIDDLNELITMIAMLRQR